MARLLPPLQAASLSMPSDPSRCMASARSAADVVPGHARGACAACLGWKGARKLACACAWETSRVPPR